MGKSVKRGGLAGEFSMNEEVLPEMLELALETLSPKELAEARVIAEMIHETKRHRANAIRTLRSLIRPPPSRPLYYLGNEMKRLPGNTRNCIRYLGDYLDLLTKEMTFEFLGGNARKTSLGRNAKALEKVSQLQELAHKLQTYAEVIYTPGKHDFSLPPGRRHRFTSAEVVYATCVTVKLADRIKSVSEFARDAVEKDYLYIIRSARWGSGTRVGYAGGGLDRSSRMQQTTQP